MMLRTARIASVAAVILSAAAAASAQPHRCTAPGLSGMWAYTETGSVVTPSGVLAAAAVGKYTFDEVGGFTGTQFSSTAGLGVGPDTKEGTYEVGHDCLGTLTLQAYRNGVLVRESVWQIVLADNATEMRGIMTSLTALVPGAGWMALQPVMTFSATRLFGDRGERDGNEHRE
jgi:hypothetical protein